MQETAVERIESLWTEEGGGRRGETEEGSGRVGRGSGSRRPAPMSVGVDATLGQEDLGTVLDGPGAVCPTGDESTRILRSLLLQDRP